MESLDGIYILLRLYLRFGLLYSSVAYLVELTEECRSVSGRSEDSEDMDPLSLAIAIVVTFVVTALLVAFLATTIGLVVSARKKRSGGKGDTNGMHSTSPYPMRDYENADEMKSDLN